MSARVTDLVEAALAASTADDCLVIWQDRTAAHLRWAINTLTTNGVSHEATASVISLARRPDGVGVGCVGGSVSATADGAAALAALVEAADAAARTAPAADDAAPLLGPDDVATSPDWSEAPVPTDIGVYATLAPALGEAFRTAADADRLLYGFVDHAVTTTFLASTTGLRLRHVQPTGHHGTTAKPRDLSRSAWVGGATRDFADVDPLAVEAELARRLAWGKRKVDLPAGRYDTIVPPSAVADLMIDAYWSSGGRDADDGRSVWGEPGAPGRTRLGERVVREGVRLFSDPAHPGLGCAPFLTTTVSGDDVSVFDNGLPLRATDWIRDGVLTTLLRPRHAAPGGAATPPIDNLVLEVDGGTGTVEDLVAGTERGLLLTCLWYLRVVDPQTLLLTGLTRDGVYVVEDGEITGVANNFRFNESPVDLLRRFTHASATVPAFGREWGEDYFSRTAMPALRVPDFAMSSVSEAL